MCARIISFARNKRSGSGIDFSRPIVDRGLDSYVTRGRNDPEGQIIVE